MQENSLTLNQINPLEEVIQNSENFTLIEVNNRKYAIKAINAIIGQNGRKIIPPIILCNFSIILYLF